MVKKPDPKRKKPAAKKKAAKPAPPRAGRDRKSEALRTLLGDLRGGPMKEAGEEE
jgi:hypothetical protein